MDELTYREVRWAEMSPDIYDGPNCDQVKPRWYEYADGDMDGDHTEEVTLSPDHFPAGTKVLVLEPECPECQQIASMCREDDCCDFDWNFWVECNYE